MAGRRFDLHTKVLPELEVGDYVQIQNLRVSQPLKSDRVEMVVFKNGNRTTLRKEVLGLSKNLPVSRDLPISTKTKPFALCLYFTHFN